MKKSLVITLALVFVLGIVSTAFAAANPFVDVPAKHWAYESVSKLAKAGIVDGYGDGTFRGDKNMTRYEMAQIVAKAMANSDKADAALKAEIAKLQVEFATELNNLGVRVAKLEKNASNIKITSESRLRYRWSDVDPADDSLYAAAVTNPASRATTLAGTDAYDWRERLHLNAAVTDKISYTARIEATGTLNNTAAAMTINRNFFTVKDLLGLDTFVIGRQGLYPVFSNYLAVGRSSNNDGVYFTEKAGKFNVGGFWMTVGANTDFKGIGFNYAANKDFEFQAGYIAADKYTTAAKVASVFTIDPVTGAPTLKYGENGAVNALASNVLDLGFSYQFAPGVSFVGEFAQSDLATNPTAWAAQLSYNWVSKIPTKKFATTASLVNLASPHDQAIAIGYRSVEAGALPGDGAFGQYNGSTASANYRSLNDSTNVEAFHFVYQNVMAKNVRLGVEYQDFQQKVGTLSNSFATAYVELFF